MNRRVVWACGLSVLLFSAAANGAEGAEKKAGRYTVPEGSVAELRQFIEGLAAFQPSTPQEDFEHRAKFRPAIGEAARKILKLEKDRSSETYRAAEYIVLANRVRWLAQVGPDQQRQVIADAKDYLKRKLGTGEAQEAVRLAEATGQTLLAAGRADLGIEASKEVVPMLRKSDDAKIRELADALEQAVRSFAESNREVPSQDRNVPPPKGPVFPLDLQAKANRNIDDLSGAGDFEGNGLAELGRGEKVLCGVRFGIGPKIVQLAGGQAQDMPKKVEGIAVDRAISRVYALHAAQWSTDDGAELGQYTVHYEDGATASIPIVYGKDVRDWWATDSGKPASRARVAWTGSNKASEKYNALVRLYLAAWENPHPEKKVAHIDFASNAAEAAPFCVAISVEGR